MKTKPVLIETPAVDYLHCTSVDTSRLRTIAEALATPATSTRPDWAPVSFRLPGGYQGVRSQATNVAIGYKTDRKGSSAMLQAWGSEAHTRVRFLYGPELSETGVSLGRIDVQFTIRADDCSVSVRDLWRALEDPRTEWPDVAGRRPGIRFVSSHSDTLYIGSRRSDRMIRIYEKEADGRALIRFEVECKGRYARFLQWNGILVDDLVVIHVLTSALRRLPERVQSNFLDAIPRNTGEFIPEEVPIDKIESYILWIQDTVIPSIGKRVSQEWGAMNELQKTRFRNTLRELEKASGTSVDILNKAEFPEMATQEEITDAIEDQLYRKKGLRRQRDCDRIEE